MRGKTPHDAKQFHRLLNEGGQFGISIEFAVQAKPNALAQALIIGTDFISDDSVAQALNDNRIYSDVLGTQLRR